MQVTVMITLRLKMDVAEDAAAVLHAVLEETRNMDGCLGVEVLEDQTEVGQFIFVERWTSQAHLDGYLAWRAGPATEALTAMMPLVADLTSVSYRQRTDI
jgi:quinol monooxygenase YgiN